MKKLFYPVLFLALTLSFQSCSSDDDNGNDGFDLNNEVIINDITYQLNSTGFLASYGGNGNGSYDWDIELVGSEIDVYLDLNTNSTDGLVEGNYIYSEERDAFTFYEVEIGFSGSEGYYSIEEGTTIEVSVDGDNIAIEFSAVTSEDGIQTMIDVKWTGTLTPFQDSGDD